MTTESHTQIANFVRSIFYLPPEPSVPLKERIAEYFKFEVLPHVPDAWIDRCKTKVKYDIPSNRHLYVYEPPLPLEVIEADAKTLKQEIIGLLAHVTSSNGVMS